jgi:argininosuccinate synthase
MDREVVYLRDSLIAAYAKMVYNGFWYAPERQLLQKTMDEAQINVTGMVRLKLYKGNCIVTGRKAEKSLYDQDIATFEEGDGYRQDDAEGFIRLNALRLKIHSKIFGH